MKNQKTLIRYNRFQLVPLNTRMNRTYYNLFITFLVWMCLAFSFMPLQIHAEFYVYKEKDGTSWITDRKMPNEKYTLMATIGRPTAVVSCRNMTPTKLEKRAADYMPTITTYAKAYEVDPKLVKAIIAVESCFDRRAISSVGAKGLMQLMPSTAKKLGVHNVFNANDNIRGGILYFSKMLARFNNNTELALAAYNAGPLAVEKYGGIPPYAETKSYVKKVLVRYNKYLSANANPS